MRPFLASLLLTVLGCRGEAVEPAHAAPDAATDGGACTAPNASSSCQSCLSASCCAEIGACEADANCKRALDCVFKCAPDNAECQSACPEVVDAKLAKALSCRAKSCEVACDVRCGGIGALFSAGGFTLVPGCTACSFRAGCAELTACAKDDVCTARLACGGGCAAFDRSCVATCDVEHETNLLGAFWRASDKCASQCESGQNFRCLGSVTWPAGKAVDTVRVSGRVEDVSALGGGPLSGVQVRSCATLDPACSVPWDTKTTDGSGAFDIDVKLTDPDRVMHGYLELTGGMPKALFPTLVFAFPPFAGPVPASATTRVGFPALSQSTVDLVLGSGSVAQDPKLGALLVDVVDCASTPALGVTIEASPTAATTSTVYLEGGLPSSTAKATSSNGIAFVLNVPVDKGPVNVTVRRPSTGQTVVQVPVVVRPGTMTVVLLAPKG